MHENTTTERSINELKSIFSNQDLPKELVTDNGPRFRAKSIQLFIKQSDIKHILVRTYQPASNGAAERSVRIVMEDLIKQVLLLAQHSA